MPRQGAVASDSKGLVEVFDEYAEGLSDIGGFSHLILLFHLDRSKDHSLKVIPFADDSPRGVFSTRAPRRPNQIGMTVVRLISVDGNKLTVSGIDMLDGTPLLDIKPYNPDIDPHPDAKTGWMGDKLAKQAMADERFGTGGEPQ